MDDMKRRKEAFVSGLTGTNIWELYLLITTSTIGLILRHIGLLSYPKIREWHQKYIIFAIIWEYCTIMLPAVLSFTVLSEHFLLILPIIGTLMLYIIISTRHLYIKRNKSRLTFPSLPFPSKPPFLSNSRTWTCVYTCIAILAVDFHIFPRRFAKVETYGTGLMDIGVGAFIMMLGVVDKEARSPTSNVPLSLKDYLLSLLNLLKSRISIFILCGLIRVVSVKAIDYQLHVSEYGVHWNFFFTMAAVKFLFVLFNPLFTLLPRGRHYSSYLIVSLLLGIGYQLLLDRTGLRNYILMGPNGDYSRNGIISANREGIFSCIGYLSIYCAGVNVGKFIFTKKESSTEQYTQRHEINEQVTVLVYVISMGIIYIVGTVLVSTYIEQVSRRMANLSFGLWICSMGLVIGSILIITDLLVIYFKTLLPSTQHASISPQYNYLSSTPSPHICLMSAIDYNQFTFFLLANLSTGLVNFTINTLTTGPIVSLCVMILHTMGLSVIIISLKKFNIKIV